MGRSLCSLLVPLVAWLAWAGCATGQADDSDARDTPPRPDVDADVAVDGGCSPPCGPGETCIRGRCMPATCDSGCPTGQQCCGDVCTDVRTDPENCGTCGVTCAPQGDSCFAGTCSCNGAAACGAGRGCCEGLGCVDIEGNVEHCGACFNACPAGVECLSGTCGGSCETGCPEVPHGDTACAGTTCAISSCDDGWADVDGVVGNGCECAVTEEPEGGETCDTAIDLGEVSDTTAGETLTASGSIIPADDADWYTFNATDIAETDCDNFFVDVRFASNPEEQFAFEVYAGDCSTSVCAGDVLFTYYTDYNDATGTEVRGECPCTAVNTVGLNICHDTTKRFYVKVRRASGTTGGTCEGYSLAISNGVYSTS
jgi:hypothetical protein